MVPFVAAFRDIVSDHRHEHEQQRVVVKNDLSVDHFIGLRRFSYQYFVCVPCLFCWCCRTTPTPSLVCLNTNSVAQEPEGSSPNAQQPATCPYPELVESNPHPPSQSPQDPF
jgi:hypothetical protein